MAERTEAQLEADKKRSEKMKANAEKKKVDDVKPVLEANEPAFAAKEDFDSFTAKTNEALEGIATSLQIIMGRYSENKVQEMASNAIRQNKPLELDEIGNQVIEKVTDNDFFTDVVELEAFMEEKLVIEVHPSNVEGDLDVITPNVNGINQPIIRGVPSVVKRKYVEALSRSRLTNYNQKTEAAALDIDNLALHQNTVMAYPFTVLEDKNPKGRPWLQALRNEAH